MAKKNRHPSQTTIKKALAASVFDPRAKTPMAVIVDMEDPRYCELRAIELIRQAQNTPQFYQDTISQAIALLALAKVQRSGTTETEKA